jgi:hypothetical protein
MIALTSAPTETPVGLVVALGGEWSHAAGLGARMAEPPFTDIDLGDVLAVVERCACDRFGGKVPGHVYGSGWDWVPCQECTATWWRVGTVRVVEVLPVTDDWPVEVPSVYIDVESPVSRTWYSLSRPDGWNVPITLPDATPGGVALVLEWTQCPRCLGHGWVHGDVHGLDYGYHPTERQPCPTCTGPVNVKGTGTILEVET